MITSNHIQTKLNFVKSMELKSNNLKIIWQTECAKEIVTKKEKIVKKNAIIDSLISNSFVYWEKY